MKCQTLFAGDKKKKKKKKKKNIHLSSAEFAQTVIKMTESKTLYYLTFYSITIANNQQER